MEVEVEQNTGAVEYWGAVVGWTKLDVGEGRDGSRGLAAVAVGWAPVGWSEGHAVSGGAAFTWSIAVRTATSALVKLRWLCLAGAAGCREVEDVMLVDGGAQAW